MSKTILITGADGGLGRPVSKYFLQSGYQVVQVMRSVPEHVGAEMMLEADLSAESSVDDLFTHLENKAVQLEAALLLAGGFEMKPFRDTSKSDLLKMWEINFATAFFISQRLLQHFKKHQKKGRIILTGAKPSLEKGGSALAAYTLSKSLLVKLSEIINEAGTSDGISASVVAPSVIDTPANRKSMPDADFSKWVTPEELAGIMKMLVEDNGPVMRDTIVKAYKGA